MYYLGSHCGNCSTWMTLPLIDSSPSGECPRCKSAVSANAFPALLKVEVGKKGQDVVVDGESGCFYHPNKKAVVACDGCGRFLCDLCSIDWSGRRLCPSCVSGGVGSGKIEETAAKHYYYDSIALFIALISMFFWIVSFLTAPVVIYICIRYWKKQDSFVGRTKIRFVAAMAIALLTLALWGVYAIRVFGV